MYHITHKFFAELERHLPTKVFKYIFANKCDLRDRRAISETEGRDYAASHEASYFETSALTGHGIDFAMHKIAEDLVEYHLLGGGPDEATSRFSTNSIDPQTRDNESNEDSKRTKSNSRFCCTIS